MANKKDKKPDGKTSADEKWFEEPVKKWSAIITGFFTIAAIGYSFALIQLNLEFRMEKFEMKQEFNEQLQKQINSCKEEKQFLHNKRVQAIEDLVKNIETKINDDN